MTRHQLIKALGALAGQQLDYIHTKLLGALVDKGKGEVHVTALTRGILLRRATRSDGHILNGQLIVLAKGPDAVGDVSTVLQVGGFHGDSSSLANNGDTLALCVSSLGHV